MKQKVLTSENVTDKKCDVIYEQDVVRANLIVQSYLYQNELQ